MAPETALKRLSDDGYNAHLQAHLTPLIALIGDAEVRIAEHAAHMAKLEKDAPPRTACRFTPTAAQFERRLTPFDATTRHSAAGASAAAKACRQGSLSETARSTRARRRC
jgi:hypothetical protein